MGCYEEFFSNITFSELKAVGLDGTYLTLLEFFKDFIRLELEHYEMDPSDHVDDCFTPEQEKIRKKARKLKTVCTNYMANLHSHVKTIHQKDKQFSCDQCNFSTLYLRNLKTHIKSFHKAKENIKCPSCKFSSAYKRNFTRHNIEVHRIRV